MIRTANIKLTGKLVCDEKDRRFSSSELVFALRRMLESSGFELIEISNRNKGVYILNCSRKQRLFTFVCFLKNITGSGWAEKPMIKRIQIPNLRLFEPSLYIDTTETSTVLILGYYDHDSNPLFVAWDFYRYTMHKTQRSCYVNIISMQEAYKKGLYKTSDSHKNFVWVFLPSRFDEFIFDYIKRNK
jgi:hypothetical protein